jgi:hypothetical protein
MNRLSSLPRSVAAAALLAGAGLANATLTVYTTQIAFNAAVSGEATDTVEDLSSLSPQPGPLNRTVGPYSYTASVGPGSPTLYTAGFVNTWLSTDVETDTITFDNFGGGVGAVGGRFFGADNGGHINPAESIMISATDASGTVSHTIVNANRFSFLGFVSDGAITSLTVTAVQAGNGVHPAVNNLVLASMVPEPESYALLLAGLAGMGVLLRRRRED